MTLMMQPSVSGPTGMVMEAPVSFTFWPQTRPSVPSLAITRTTISPKMHGDLEDQLVLSARDLKGIENGQESPSVSTGWHIDDGTNGRADAADGARRRRRRR